MSKFVCTACLKQFSGRSTFDAHRTGSHVRRTRRCLTDSEMIDRGMFCDVRSIWRTVARAQPVHWQRRRA
jgi:hypothetical protein